MSINALVEMGVQRVVHYILEMRKAVSRFVLKAVINIFRFVTSRFIMTIFFKYYKHNMTKFTLRYASISELVCSCEAYVFLYH